MIHTDGKPTIAMRESEPLTPKRCEACDRYCDGCSLSARLAGSHLLMRIENRGRPYGGISVEQATAELDRRRNA